MRYDCSFDEQWTVSLIVDEEEVFARFGRALRVKIGWAGRHLGGGRSALMFSRKIGSDTLDIQNACRDAMSTSA